MKFFLEFLFLILCVISDIVNAEDWWEYGNFYQIYPRSFQDSDGDGIGDLKGITQRLNYFKYLGVTGIWLSPIFKSPMKDFGYDISDYREIQPEYGTMEDFDFLLKRCNEMNLKLILDFVPNHSSDQHVWFQKSSNPNDPEFEKYKDYYVWNRGQVLANGTRVPPSNWLSVFRGSAWEWSDTRQQYYLHQFLTAQPDLNFHNPQVNQELKEILRFYLDKGVSGFRIDAVPYFYEAPENSQGLYDNEPKSGECSDDPEAACYLNHTLTFDQKEDFTTIYDWRKVTDEYSNPNRILMTEAYSTLSNTLRYYGNVSNGAIVQYGSQIPFNFQLFNVNISSSACDFRKTIADWLNNMPNGAGIHANWVMGNHDQPRIASRFGPEKVDLLNILMKTLPGIAITYYGEEIGMTDVYISWKDTVDPQACRTNPDVYEKYTRDPSRSPFQWNNKQNGGFSTATETWLPVAKNYTSNNVQIQSHSRRSHLKVFRKLISLRKNPTMKYGGIEMETIDCDLLVYKRSITGRKSCDVFFVVLNFGSTYKTISLKNIFTNVPKKLKVVVSSIESQIYSDGNKVKSSKIVVQPNVGIVFSGKRNCKKGCKKRCERRQHRHRL